MSLTGMHMFTNSFLTPKVNQVKRLTNIFYRIHCEKITAAARTVWIDQEEVYEISSSVLEILAKASKQNLRFFCGKSPKCILGGLFYILGFRFRAPKTQNEIADFLCTTEASISKSYKSWLNEFPQYFTDVTDKIRDHNSKKSIANARLKPETWISLRQSKSHNYPKIRRRWS